MRKIDTLEERHSVLLNLLVQFDSLCKDLDVRYMLAYGTLLGAVRHKGFIPWDDDVDVMMTREEYDKFISRYTLVEDARYKFISREIDPNYFSPLAKYYDDNTILVQKYGQRENKNYGIYLDVFIIDALSDNVKEAIHHIDRAEKIRFYWALSVKSFSAGSKSLLTRVARVPVILACRLVGRQYFLNKYYRIAQEYRYKNTNHCGVVIYGEGFKKEYFENKLYEDICFLSFEGFDLPAPKDYDRYLSQMYGDYMSIPKDAERKVHPNDAFWK